MGRSRAPLTRLLWTALLWTPGVMTLAAPARMRLLRFAPWTSPSGGRWATRLLFFLQGPRDQLGGRMSTSSRGTSAPTSSLMSFEPLPRSLAFLLVMILFYLVNVYVFFSAFVLPLGLETRSGASLSRKKSRCRRVGGPFATLGVRASFGPPPRPPLSRLASRASRLSLRPLVLSFLL